VAPNQTQPDECDVVMKGGITSGILYPAAVVALAKRYRFRSIGGASAGAIAAALAAAAEYGERTGGGGFATLDQVAGDLARQDALLSLFQPTAKARPLFEIALGFAKDPHAKGRRKVRRAITGVIRRAIWIWVPSAVLMAGLIVAVSIGSHGSWRLATIPLAVVFVVIAVAAALVASFGYLGLQFYRGLNENWFGLCSGRAEAGQGAAFTDWLHTKVQACAGLDPESDQPLTFAMLRQPPNGPPIDLRLITTDLSYSRPVALPFPDRQYLFKRSDMQKLFPDKVVEGMWNSGQEVGPEFEARYLTKSEAGEFRYVPGDQLPIVVAFRLSLSFPILISGVRLYSYNALNPKGLQENWFSDGGISSNFPIHFFDSLLPARPTFGLDFEPFPRQSADTIEPMKPADVWMPNSPYEQQPPRWAEVRTLPGFLSQIIDAFENWRDTMQSELPGFRDRICHIRLRQDEGGMNIAMPPEIITGLIDRGRRAGQLILDQWNEGKWIDHRFTRYLTTMQMLQISLQKMGQPDRWGLFGPFLHQGAQGVGAFRSCHEAAWCERAADATDSLIALTNEWGSADHVSFYMDTDCGRPNVQCQHCEPEPTPSLRVVPNV
jgi:predicted acylesterase/phospholipase RssA